MRFMTQIRQWMRGFSGDLLRRQCGSVLVLWAFAAVPVVIGVGTVVDISRAYMARSRLAFALDAAGLAAGAAGNTEAEINAIAQQFFFLSIMVLTIRARLQPLWSPWKAVSLPSAVR